MTVQVMWNPDTNKRDLYIVVYDIPELQAWQADEIKRLAREIEVVVRHREEETNVG